MSSFRENTAPFYGRPSPNPSEDYWAEQAARPPSGGMSGITSALTRNLRMGSATDLTGHASRFDELKARQEHENDVATTVIVCEPERSTVMMGGLHPRASLFEKTVHLDKATKQHRNFREVLAANGLKVCPPPPAAAACNHGRSRLGRGLATQRPRRRPCRAGTAVAPSLPATAADQSHTPPGNLAAQHL